MYQDYSTDNYNHSRASSGLKALVQNLSRKQKITIIIILQVLLIIIIISVANSILSKPKDHVGTLDDRGILKDIPQAEIELYEQELWKVVSATDENLDRSIINDAVVREESYTEDSRVIEDTGNTSHQVSFIIDIDSIKQSYKIILSWEKNFYNTPIVDCLPVSEAKYPNSFCQGTYRNSYDLSLYLPYQIDSINNADYDDIGSDVYIDGDEYTHTITVSLSPCNVEENKKKANTYLQTIPKIEKYQINYVIKDGIDVICAEDQ